MRLAFANINKSQNRYTSTPMSAQKFPQIITQKTKKGPVCDLQTGPFRANKLAQTALFQRQQIHRSKFSATINFNVKRKPVAFVEVGHPGALYGRDVNEGIGLAIIALNEAEAFHCVEEFDGACGLFAG